MRELAQGVDDDRSGRQLRFAEQVITAARKAGMTDAALTEALARYDRAQIDTFFVAHNVPQSDLAHEVAP